MQQMVQESFTYSFSHSFVKIFI